MPDEGHAKAGCMVDSSEGGREMDKKLLVAMVLVLLTASLFPSGEKEAPARAGAEAVVPVTYMYATGDAAKFPLDADRPNVAYLLKLARDNFGMEVRLEPIMSSQLATVFNTRLAANNLPDLVDYRVDQNRLVELYRQGQIIALNDLVDKYGPRIKQLLFQFDPYLLIANGDAEGHLLRFCRQVANIQHRVRVLNINLAWLEELGLAIPQTTDELFDALVAFRQKDMNKNGLQDEFASGLGIIGLNQALANAFGVKDMSNARESFYADKDSKVYHTMLTPEAKSYFAYLAKMANAGVLDKEVLNQTGEQWNAKCYTYRVSLFVDAYWGPVTMDSVVRSKGFPKCEYIQMVPPPHAAGVQPSITVRNLPGYNGYMITKSAKAPDRITKWMNWAMTTEGSQQEYYGATSGNLGDYYYPQKEYKGYPLAEYVLIPNDKYKADLQAEPLLRQKLGINTGLLPHMLYGTPGDVAMGLETNWSTVAGRGSNFEMNIKKLTQIEKQYNVPGFAMVAPSVEQSKIFEQYTDLFLYIDEMTQKFSIGTAPLTQWDSFLAQCDKLGLKEVLKVVQDRYNAYAAIMGK
jgi:putative aldouronate transport system substrate-binding protein